MRIADHFDRPLSVRRILIIQLGDIGDIVWSFPAIRAVRNSYPEAEVSILLREGNGSLIGAQTLPIETFEVRKGRESSYDSFVQPFRLVMSLLRKRFDLVFDFRTDERGGYMAYLTRAPIRAARYYSSVRGLRNHLFTHLVDSPAELLGIGAADQSLYILKAFGITTDDPVPKLHLSEEAVRRGREIIDSMGLAVFREGSDIKRLNNGDASYKTWVTLNPFSRWSYKEWGIEKWMQVINWLYEEFGMVSVVVGSPDERRKAETIAEACGGKVFNLAGKTTLGELAGVLSFSRLHIGVDSAAPHIAAAVGAPTVTIYGPSDWRYWAPPGKRNRIVAADMPCVPCSQKGCNGSGRSICLEILDVEKVKAVIREAVFEGLRAFP